MAIKITKNPKSVTIKNGENIINVVVTSQGFEFHESLNDKGAAAARQTEQKIKEILLHKMNVKNNYSIRIAKLVSVVEGMGKIDSFSKLNSRLNKVVFA